MPAESKSPLSIHVSQYEGEVLHINAEMARNSFERNDIMGVSDAYISNLQGKTNGGTALSLSACLSLYSGGYVCRIHGLAASVSFTVTPEFPGGQTTSRKQSKMCLQSGLEKIMIRLHNSKMSEIEALVNVPGIPEAC